MSGLHSCKDCGVNFDSGKSLDVHLHYHKENLMSKWIQQATTSSEDNNNVKKNGRATSSSVQPADSSESYYTYQQQQEGGGLLYGHQENGSLSAFHRIRNFARYHPYQQQAVSSSSASSQCDKCGFVTDNMLEHVQTAHPPPTLPPFNFGAAYIKEEAQILDLDSQKVHVYPNGEEPPQQQNDLQQQQQPPPPQQPPPQPPPQHSPWENKFFEEPKKEEQVPSPYHYQNQNHNHDDDKDKKLFYEEKRYVLEENGNGSPDFGSVSTTSSSDVMQYYEPMREVSVPKLPPIIKPVGGASWKSNEARRPKTYNCTACNKWFTSSGHLKRHYNTTLHKNAVKQSGVLDPATLPISAHHHPPKEDDKLEPPPVVAPPPPAPFANYHIPDHEPYQHPEPFHYPQYPNALPPHVTSIGSPQFQYQERPLPSFQQGFQTVFNQDFNDVGGLYDAFETFQHDDDTMDEDLSKMEPESILPDDVPCSTTDSNAMTVVPTSIIKEEPMITTTIIHHIPQPIQKPIQQTTVVSSTNEPQVHKCLDCDKTFNKACYLTQHNKSFHSGDKPFKCSRCGKRFTQEILHLEHLSKHGGDKPHKCEMCPKQFNHKTDLRRHMCLHSGDKPFACDYCGKGFIRKDHMLKHAETHKRKQQQQQGLLQQRSMLKKQSHHRLLLDSNMNQATTLQVQ